MEINKKFIETLNKYGTQRKPIFFAIDFESKKYFLEDEKTFFKLENFQNYKIKSFTSSFQIKEEIFVDFNTYKKSLQKVKDEIKKGNTYLLNLTFETKLIGSINLEEIFYNSNAPFKLYIKDKFVCFSPERFVKIKNNQISTYPMKGTIDANIKSAKEKILANAKEMSEHVMAVDLLRNDLGMVAKNINVEKFRYIDKINAGEKELLQVSSKITGDLNENWQNSLGNIISYMLPAGSITGTPKNKTVSIIKKIENYNRGFFTGIFGYFDGENFDSAVMIRFIEKQGKKYVFKSGGGITCDSNEVLEYQEMKDKVYVPLF